MRVHQVRSRFAVVVLASYSLAYSKVFPDQPVSSFHGEVRKLILAELDGLDPTALLGVKRLIKAGINDQTNLDAVNLRESYAQTERFASGIPGERFGKIARKELKHKL